MAAQLSAEHQFKMERMSLILPYSLAGGGLLVTAVIIGALMGFSGIKPANVTEVLAIVAAFTSALGTLIGALVGIKIGAAAGEETAKAVQKESDKKDRTIADTQANLVRAHETLIGAQTNLATVHEQLAQQSKLLDEKTNLLQKAIAELPKDQVRNVLTP